MQKPHLTFFRTNINRVECRGDEEWKSEEVARVLI